MECHRTYSVSASSKIKDRRKLEDFAIEQFL